MENQLLHIKPMKYQQFRVFRISQQSLLHIKPMKYQQFYISIRMKSIKLSILASFLKVFWTCSHTVKSSNMELPEGMSVFCKISMWSKSHKYHQHVTTYGESAFTHKTNEISTISMFQNFTTNHFYT